MFETVGPVFMGEIVSPQLYRQMLEKHFITVYGSKLPYHRFMQSEAFPHHTNSIFELQHENAGKNVIAMYYPKHYGCESGYEIHWT